MKDLGDPSPDPEDEQYLKLGSSRRSQRKLTAVGLQEREVNQEVQQANEQGQVS